MVHFNLAVVLTSKLEKHAKALKHCTKSLKLDPSNYKAMHLLGIIFQNLGRAEEAEKYFVMAEELANPSSPPTQSSDTGITNNNSNRLDNKEYSIAKAFESMRIYTMEEGDAYDHMIDEKLFTLKCVSTAPRIFIIQGFLSQQECDYIIAKANPNLEKSFVMGNSVSSNREEVETKPYRSSENAWLPADAKLQRIQTRLAEIVGIPTAYVKQKSEELQV